ncbi:MAG: GSCFA domain-containing protein [Rhodobacteraceae bacterium]|nr:GSCFA domain-containing protein [Paracoccaceae bacterium]
MTDNPYESLPASAFWRTAVADLPAQDIRGLWQPKFDISEQSCIITAGSCFAQHIGRALRERGYGWYDAEPAPGSVELQKAYQYGLFSFRTGNIYTTRMLNQWVRWAHAPDKCPDMFWQTEGGIFDPFRPTVEMDGFLSIEEARASRRSTLAAIMDAVRKADVLIFTLGLTECWREKETGIEYAMCPGTVAGTFDPEIHEFHNMNYSEVVRELNRAIASLRKTNPNLHILLTVSPVPLTASATGQHVLNATSYSKSVLRAAAGAIAESSDFIDYFPSYEIITNPVFEGRFYAANKRSIRPEGVDHVMRCFFHDLAVGNGRPVEAPVPAMAGAMAGAQTDDDDLAPEDDDAQCDEEMLAAFQPEQNAKGA